MEAAEIGIGVIKERIITWTNSTGKEFEWGHVGMAVDILETWESTYIIADFDRAAAPTQVFRKTIEKIDVVWKVLR